MRLLAALVLAIPLVLAGCATSQKGGERSAGEFTDDAAVTARVKSAIATDVGARTAAAVNVDTYRGVVQLTGFVDSDEQASRAAAAAKKVSGVRSIKNDLRIKKGS